MYTKSRQDQIVELLEQQGYVTVKQLCDTLHYSSATINRDLNALVRRGLVARSYGGAELVRSVYVPIPVRSHQMGLEKRRIGKAAAAFVQDGDTIFIDGSTTAQYMERFLIERRNLTVVTNNILLTVNLSGYDIRVICLGGTVAEQPCMLFGTETVENAEKYKVDKMFFSTTAMTEDGLISSSLYDPLFKAVVKNAGEIFFLVDSKKIGLRFDKIYGDLSAVDCVISDYEFSEETVARFRETKFVRVE